MYQFHWIYKWNIHDFHPELQVHREKDRFSKYGSVFI